MSTDIVHAIQQEMAAFAGTAGVAAKHLGTGETILVNAHDETATASTIKVPILIELMRRVENGEIDLTSKLQVPPATPGSGVLRDLSTDIQLRIEDVAILMIAVSDNTATNMLIDLLGVEAINKTMVDTGFPTTRLLIRFDFPKVGQDARNLSRTTPAELCGIMEKLATNAILTPESCRKILDILLKQHYTGQVPRYLPHGPYNEELGVPNNGLKIANKTGGWRGMRADMALVEWPGTQYVIGVVTENDPDTRFWSENAGDQVIGRISDLIFKHWGGAAVPPLP